MRTAAPPRGPAAPGEEKRASPAAEEELRQQAVVLWHLLEEHPTQLRHCDLVRELSENPADFAECDAVAQAVGKLIRVGLAHEQGECVLPTRTTLYYAELASHMP